MALDHRRLIRPEKKIRTIFLRSTSLLCVILPTNLGTCKPTFYTIYTSHLRWNSTMRYCFYHTDLGQNAVFHNLTLQYKLHSFNIQDDRSMHALLAKRLKKIPKPPIRPAGSHFRQCEMLSSVWMNINRVTLQHNKEYIMDSFYLMVLSTCNLQKRLIRAAFWVHLQAMFTERLKTNGTPITITRETTNNQ